MSSRRVTQERASVKVQPTRCRREDPHRFEEIFYAYILQKKLARMLKSPWLNAARYDNVPHDFHKFGRQVTEARYRHQRSKRAPALVDVNLAMDSQLPMP